MRAFGTCCVGACMGPIATLLWHMGRILAHLAPRYTLSARCSRTALHHGGTQVLAFGVYSARPSQAPHGRERAARDGVPHAPCCRGHSPRVAQQSPPQSVSTLTYPRMWVCALLAALMFCRQLQGRTEVLAGVDVLCPRAQMRRAM